MEIWKSIRNYEGLYEISSLGRVKSLATSRENKSGRYKGDIILKNGVFNNYAYVILYKDKKAKNFLVHRLVAINFISNLENKCCVNHIDGNKLNNCVENLEWCTQSENQIHAYKIGLQISTSGEKMWNSKLTDKTVLEIRELYTTGNYTYKNLSNLYNVNVSAIQKIIKRKTWKLI